MDVKASTDATFYGCKGLRGDTLISFQALYFCSRSDWKKTNKKHSMSKAKFKVFKKKKKSNGGFHQQSFNYTVGWLRGTCAWLTRAYTAKSSRMKKMDIPPIKSSNQRETQLQSVTYRKAVCLVSFLLVCTS